MNPNFLYTIVGNLYLTSQLWMAASEGLGFEIMCQSLTPSGGL